jgi:hypothetical protein
MMFRKLYWVTEGVDAESSSHILGVYTSIPTLIRNGFSADTDPSRTRLSLTRLDCDDGILATWIGEEYQRLRGDLQQFVDSDDFTADQAEALYHAVSACSRAAIR